jgi:hypothetical protein
MLRGGAPDDFIGGQSGGFLTGKEVGADEVAVEAAA